MEQAMRIEGNNISRQLQGQGQGQDQDQDQDQEQDLQIPPPRKCPRCDSNNTKFCYYNNYSHAQPRYFCKACRRYWTHGGTLRNVPVGGGCRKNKRPRTPYPALVASNDIAAAAAAAAAAASQRYQPGAGNFPGRIPIGVMRPVVPPMGSFLYPGGINQTGMLNFGGGGNSMLGHPSVKPPVAATSLFQAPPDACNIFQSSIPPRNLNSWNHRFTGIGSGTSSAAGRGFYWNSGHAGDGGNSAGSAFDENKSSEINRARIDRPPSDE